MVIRVAIISPGKDVPGETNVRQSAVL